VTDELVNVRYMAGDVEEAVAFYTTHVGFTVRSNYAPAFADVVRGHLRRRPLGGGTSGTSATRTATSGRSRPPPDHRPRRTRRAPPDSVYNILGCCTVFQRSDQVDGVRMAG
jgi:catechol 2,3-dioxygenase-like lactoylglutathione lyase family enzyme